MMAELTLETLAIAARDRGRWSHQGVDLEVSVNLAPSALQNAELIERSARP